MDRFEDSDGTGWEATIGRESWGTFVILFTRRGGGEVRKAVLRAETMIEAQQELDAMDEAGLRQRLSASEPWQ